MTNGEREALDFVKRGETMTWDFKNDQPIYRQLMDGLRLRIVNGTYPPGERIPAVRELAMEAGVNPNTMQRALAELEREGLLISQRTSGRFVTDDQDLMQALRVNMAREYIAEMFEMLRRLGLSPEQSNAAIDKFQEEQAAAAGRELKEERA